MRRVVETRLIPGLVVACTLSVAATAVAQDWSWPERAENLQVLPEDIPAQRLRAAMTGFTRALGVRCHHCHVGKEGQPLVTYDFASDDNPRKSVARSMLTMLGDINEHLDGIEPSGPGRVNVWCHTCHRGVARPMRLHEQLMETYEQEGVDASVTQYRRLRDRHYGRGAYDFSETSLNVFGYQLLGRGDHNGAIAVFELNAEMLPESANAYDSLAEGHAAAGNRDRAIDLYQKSLELNPDNENAAGRLRKLRNP
jgi:tetratricopeptide (TPR) repeat protein